MHAALRVLHRLQYRLAGSGSAARVRREVEEATSYLESLLEQGKEDGAEPFLENISALSGEWEDLSLR